MLCLHINYLSLYIYIYICVYIKVIVNCFYIHTGHKILKHTSFPPLTVPKLELKIFLLFRLN